MVILAKGNKTGSTDDEMDKNIDILVVAIKNNPE